MNEFENLDRIASAAAGGLLAGFGIWTRYRASKKDLIVEFMKFQQEEMRDMRKRIEALEDDLRQERDINTPLKIQVQLLTQERDILQKLLDNDNTLPQE